MKVCTFNVNSIRARAELVLKWLEKREYDIDILCLQELKVTDDKFPYQAFAEAGYHCTVFGQSRFNGVAVCSKEKPDAVAEGFMDPRWDEQKRILQCRFGDLTVINVYAPHGDLRGTEKYKYKQEWYRHFLQYIGNNFSPSDRLVVVGDMNVALSDLDVYDAEALKDVIGTMPEERELLNALLNWGLVDTFRYLYPEKKEFTWWDYMTAAIWRNEGMRIDYVFCTHPLVKRLSAVETDLWPRRRRVPTPSDHAPVIATFS